MIHKIFISREFIRFVLVGGLAAIVNFAARIVLSTQMSYRWSIIVAYIIGMLTAYILSRIFVFERSGRRVSHELTYFTLVNLLAIAQVWLISVGLAEYLFPRVGFTFYPEAVAHIIGLCVPIFTSFLGHKYWSFKPKVERV